MFPDYPVYYTDLPQGAMLDPWENCVYMDYRFKTYPVEVRNFAWFHEMAHLFFDTKEGRSLKIEKDCDEVAADQMLKINYSVPQIIGALETCLIGSDELEARRNNLLRYLGWQ